MDFRELGINVIEYILANIPQIMVVITAIFTSFKTLNTRVDSFIKLSDKSGKEIKKETLEAINKIEVKLTEGIEETVEKTKNTLEKMENAIETQAGQMKSIIETQAGQIEQQTENIKMLVNKIKRLEETVFLTIELLIEALSQDARKVSEGVSRKLNEKFKKSQVKRNEETTL